MMTALETFWRARTPRERLLMSLVVWLALFVGAPLMLWQAASGYKYEASAALERAQALRAAVSRLDPALVAKAPPTQGGARDMATAEANALGLSVTRIEPAGPDRLKVSFAPGDSLAVLTWIDRMTRAGHVVEAAALVRVQESDLVQADVEIRAAGP